MSRKKSYCIIQKDGFVYFPIKAKIGPYRSRETGELITGYLAGMPNFFGGTVEDGENIYSTLVKEVEEESQGNIKINVNPTDRKEEQERKIMEACATLKTFIITTNRGRRSFSIEYYFYSLNADSYQPGVTIGGFGSSNRLELSTAETLEEKKREMSCVLKIPVNQLHKNFDNFLDKCIETGNGHLMDKGAITAHQDWQDEGTQNAFREFCNRCGV